MKKTISVLIIVLICLAGSLIFHNPIEHFLPQMQFSWTFSKLAPYVLEFILIVWLSMLMAKFIQKLALRKFVLIACILLLCGIAFAINPIYKGDFAHTYQEVVVSNKDAVFPRGLTMIALPGCPYCLERVNTLNDLKDHVSNLPITVVFTGADSSVIEGYRSVLNPEIRLEVSANKNLLLQAVGESFPSFVLNSDKYPIVYHWSQTGFGTGAMDWLASQEKN